MGGAARRAHCVLFVSDIHQLNVAKIRSVRSSSATSVLVDDCCIDWLNVATGECGSNRFSTRWLCDAVTRYRSSALAVEDGALCTCVRGGGVVAGRSIAKLECRLLSQPSVRGWLYTLAMRGQERRSRPVDIRCGLLVPDSIRPPGVSQVLEHGRQLFFVGQLLYLH